MRSRIAFALAALIVVFIGLALREEEDSWS
jgi:hypothetical protein